MEIHVFHINKSCFQLWDVQANGLGQHGQKLIYCYDCYVIVMIMVINTLVINTEIDTEPFKEFKNSDVLGMSIYGL